MPVEHIISLLIAERDRLERAIEALQGSVKRRGRPPKSASSSPPQPTAAAPVKKKAAWPAAKRRAQAEKIKAYWAKRNKAAKS
jgi:hypothetical protein